MDDITAVGTPAEAGSDPSLSSALDELITMPSSGGDAPSADTTEAAPAAETTAPAPEPEAPAAEAADESVEQELPDDDEEALERINQRAGSGQKEIRVDVNRWKRVYDGGYKQMQAIQQAVPGITPELARENYEFANGFLQMQADFKSGTPEGVAKVAEFLANGMDDAPSESFALLTETAANTLREANPQAFDNFQKKIFAPTIQALYDKADQTRNEHDLYVARALDWQVNNKYRKEDFGTPKPQADPLSEREADLARREQAIQQNTAQQRDALWGENYSKITSGIDRVVSEATDLALKNVAKQFEQFPRVWTAIRKDVASGIREKAEGDRQFLDAINRDIGVLRNTHNRAWGSGQRLDLSRGIDALVTQYKMRADGFAAAVAKPIVNEAANKLVQNNAATHQRRAATAESTKGPASGGAPVRKSIVDRQALDKARNPNEILDALFASR